jgi:hypothetical protein
LAGYAFANPPYGTGEAVEILAIVAKSEPEAWLTQFGEAE